MRRGQDAGGEGGIRTHAPCKRRSLFESDTINRSDTSPGHELSLICSLADGIVVQRFRIIDRLLSNSLFNVSIIPFRHGRVKTLGGGLLDAGVTWL